MRIQPKISFISDFWMTCLKSEVVIITESSLQRCGLNVKLKKASSASVVVSTTSEMQKYVFQFGRPPAVHTAGPKRNREGSGACRWRLSAVTLNIPPTHKQLTQPSVHTHQASLSGSSHTMLSLIRVVM